MIFIILAALALFFLQGNALSTGNLYEDSEDFSPSKIGKKTIPFVKKEQGVHESHDPTHNHLKTNSFFMDDEDDSDYEPTDTEHVEGIDLSRFPVRDIEQKRPFVFGRAFQENLPPSPQELTPEEHSYWTAFPEGAYLSYAGMTRRTRAQLKGSGYQFMMPSPPKKPRAAPKITIKNSSRLFETSAELQKLQGFSRQSYRFMVDEGRMNLSLEEALKPLLDYFQTKRIGNSAARPDDANRLFWETASPFFDIQEKIGDHIFCLNSNHIQGTESQSRIVTGRNPLLNMGGILKHSDYHHLTQGMSSPEIIVCVSSDFHDQYHDLLHQFLKPGQDSIAHGVGTEREWSRAKKEFHQILHNHLREKEGTEGGSPQLGLKRGRSDHHKTLPPAKKRRLFPEEEGQDLKDDPSDHSL